MSTDHPADWTRYIALGDSFTEGMSDLISDPDGEVRLDPTGKPHVRGWADRIAERIHELRLAQGKPGLEYANLAIRGRLLNQILDEQLPAALEAKPDLVSLVGGGNDALRPGSDIDAIAGRMERAVAELRAAGSQVLMGTIYDPVQAPVIKVARGRIGIYNAHLWSIANRHGAAMLDLWGSHFLRDWRMWDIDRLHLNSEGHRRVADLAATALGIPPLDAGWREAMDPAPPKSRRDAVRDDIAWATDHLAPWVHRRIKKVSSGDGREAKRPRLSLYN